MNNRSIHLKLSVISKRKDQIQLLTHVFEKPLVHIDLLKYILVVDTKLM